MKGGDLSIGSNYFGTVAGLVCTGRVESLVSVLIDGKEVWPKADLWVSGDAIVTGDLRSYQSRTYEAQVDHTASTANAPPASAFWTEYTLSRLSLQDPYTPYLWGVWDAGLPDFPVYNVGDRVRYEGRTYQCISQAHASLIGGLLPAPVPPDDPGHWLRLQTPGSGTFCDVGIDGYGSLRIYWGTEDQEIDPDLNNAETGANAHPAYKGDCYIILLDFLFGADRPATPNCEVVVRRAPQQYVVSTDLAKLSTDGQANPVAAAAEILTSHMATGLAQTWIDNDSFNDTALELEVNSDLFAISLLLDSQTTVRDVFTRLAETCDAWMRFNAEIGMIEAGLFTHGVVPTVYTTLRVDDLVERPRFTGQSWEQAKSAAVITFIDRERLFKQTSERIPDLRTQRVLGESREMRLDRPWITRTRQARKHAAEFLRVAGRPQLTGMLSVRREKALELLPGDMVLADIEVSPGGASLYQWFRVLSRDVPAWGPITLDLDADETMTPLAHVPERTPEPPEDLTPPEITNFRVIPSIHNLSENQGDILVLAERPSLAVDRCAVWISEAEAGIYERLGQFRGFAVRATLVSDIVETDSVFSITVPDQVDKWLIADSPGPIRAIHNYLLGILVKVSGTQIATRPSGWPWVEATSIETVGITAQNTYQLTVLRRRLRCRPFPFTATDTEVWIALRSALKPFWHQGMKDPGV